ncbi:hypothetical protein [Xanthomonas cannabis]|uniref:hypothetical protein n=1 Tax=Xanthomonas cannabis TaxID=1885674 RepID=UPI00141B6B39|nr:hypothetical protein [Xanthomonas cannabis]NIK20757.1 hypothetical protein [Xanthomonas cannabis]
MATRKDIDELRLRRIKLARNRELSLLREEHGERLASILSRVARRQLVLSDFSFDAFPLSRFSPLSGECKVGDLSASYINISRAKQIASCVERKIVLRSGYIGIYGNEYLGLCYVEDCSINGMVLASQELNETVIFYLDEIAGEVMVDCYQGNKSGSFCVSVRGIESASLSACFRENDKSA